MSNEQFSRYQAPEEDFTVHLIDDRRMVISPWSRGNTKLGSGIATYSTLPGKLLGTCPGSSDECEAVCYAKRAVQNPWVGTLWKDNQARGDDIPPPPLWAKTIRFHVSGDFHTVGYIRAWIKLAADRPDVTFFGYTRSWRVDYLLPDLETFRALPNVHLFASVDASMSDEPPAGWRIAWLEGDLRVELHPGGAAGKAHRINRIRPSRVLVCPEERGIKANCQECGYCFRKGADVYFLKSAPKSTP